MPAACHTVHRLETPPRGLRPPCPITRTLRDISNCSGGGGGGSGGSSGGSGSSFVLIGHSTGCQDAVFYMKHGRPDLRAKVLGVVLQVKVEFRRAPKQAAGHTEHAF